MSAGILDSIKSSLCNALLAYKKSYEEHFAVKFILVPLGFALPYTLAIMYSNPAIRASFKSAVDLPQEDCFIDKNLWIIYILAAVLSYIGAKLYDIAKFINERGLFNDVKTAAFNTVWDKLVESKINRFVFVATSSEISTMSKEDIFAFITRPDQQKIVLATLLREYMTKQYGGEFKVRILGINDENAPQEWLAADPENPETSAASLNDPSSTVSHCLKRKKITIIESISDELNSKKRHYTITHDDEKEDAGSMVCIPCCSRIKNGKIDSIVIIWCNKEHFFKNREKTRIESIAKQIQLRIQLEQTLEQLKA